MRHKDPELMKKIRSYIGEFYIEHDRTPSAGHQPTVRHRKEHVKRPFEVSILNDKFNDKPARIGYYRAGGFYLSS